MTDIEDKNVEENSLESKLERIRLQSSSKLAHQKHLSIILSAVEENLKDENTELSAVAFFASFLALIEQAISEESITNRELANSAVYLLDLISPHVSASLLKSRFPTILQKLALVLTSPDADAAIVRSSIGVLESILIAQDSSSWASSASQISPKRGVMGLLSLATDARPKVRKRAQDALTNILRNPPPSPKMEHPAGEICAEFALTALQGQLAEKAKASNTKKKFGGSTSERDAKIIHTLQLIRSICDANGWPSAMIEPLCESLLKIARSTDHYLISSVFNVFEAIFRSLNDEVDAPKLRKVLDTIFDLTPALNDQHLVPAWMAVVAEAGSAYSRIEPQRAFESLPAYFIIVIKFLEADSKNIHISAAQCLIALVSIVITPEILLLDKKGHPKKSSDEILAKISESVFGLLHIKYQSSWKEVSEVLIAIFDTLRWRASPHFENTLKVVGALRSEEAFSDGSEEADKVIAAAIRALGPEIVLKHLPLHLPPEDKAVSKVWLLPLLRDNIQHPTLSHFIKDILPISYQLQEKIGDMNMGGKPEGNLAVQVKIFETLVDQIWSLLPRYTDLPFDLRESFTQKFAETLANILYEKVEYRPVICQALRLLVESNTAYAEGAVDDDIMLLQRFPKSEASKNIEYLAHEFATKLLSVLFNVFSQTAPESRGYVLETITAYLAITSTKDIESTFNKVGSLLHSSLESESTESKRQGKKDPFKMSVTMMDLVVAMTPYLPKSSHNTLLSIFVQTSRAQNTPLLQKRAFKMLTKLAETSETGGETIKENISNIETTLIELTDQVSSPARGARLVAISCILDYIPETDLYLIPSLLSETVLSTKDVNEKTRDAAFTTLVKMGNKMKEGGTVVQSKVPNMGKDAIDTKATLEEFFTMVSAGLAGSSPHMISSTITALSRILFEFRNELSVEYLSELASTIDLFLTSDNKEIVKSALGFVKITVISLPVEVIEGNLKPLIENLMVWSHEHKSQFKAKVKHIIERLMRRLGYEKIAEVFPEQDLKLLTNIRKQRARSKRKKATAEENEGEGSRSRASKYDNEFDEAVYGSSSESDASDDDNNVVGRGQKNKNSDRYIVESKDAPLDLLDSRSLAHITSSKPRASGQKGPALKAKNKFSKDESGKLIIKDIDEENNYDEEAMNKNSVDAYIDAVKNGPVRGQRNKLKFKRSRKDDDSDDEDDSNESFKKQTNFRQKKPAATRKKFKSNRKL